MNPFDLPGPSFLGLYIPAVIVALLLRTHLRERCRSSVVVPRRLPRLTPYEAAFLVQGRERVAETALAKLAHDGAIAPAPEGGGFAVQAPLPAEADPLLHEVYRDVQAGRRWPELLSAASSAALDRIESRLQREGLLAVEGSPEAACWHRTSWLLWAVIAFGTVKLVVGLSRGRPVGILMVLLVVTLLIALFSRALPRLSARGEHVVPALLKRNAALGTTALRRGSDLAEADMLLGVALFGSTVLAAGALAWIHQAVAPPASRSGGGDAGSSCGSSSCSSSCSGGCGGGCGGCGS